MSILNELLSMVKDNNLDEQMRIACDQLMEEEKDNFKYLEFHPDNVNIFITMELKASKSTMYFLTLERESVGIYVIRKYSRRFGKKIIRKEVDDELIYPPLKIIESTSCKFSDLKRILIEFAEKFKFELGE